MKTTIKSSSKNLLGASAPDLLMIAALVGIIGIMGIQFFTARAEKARAQEITAILQSPTPVKSTLRKPESVVLQERIDQKIAELQALNEAHYPAARQAEIEARLYAELGELKKLQSSAFQHAPGDPAKK